MLLIVSSVVPSLMACTPTIALVASPVLGVVLDGSVVACSNSGATTVVASGVVAPIAPVKISALEAVAIVGDVCIGARCSADLSGISAVAKSV